MAHLNIKFSRKDLCHIGHDSCRIWPYSYFYFSNDASTSIGLTLLKLVAEVSKTGKTQSEMKTVDIQQQGCFAILSGISTHKPSYYYCYYFVVKAKVEVAGKDVLRVANSLFSTWHLGTNC